MPDDRRGAAQGQRVIQRFLTDLAAPDPRKQIPQAFIAHVFRQLIKISGIGARTALSVLSGLSVAELAQAVSLQDSARLVKVPGIGKKTAERLLLELKGKLGGDLALPATVANDAQADILQALVALGYSEKDAAAALKVLPPDVGVSDGIKLALKKLS